MNSASIPVFFTSCRAVTGAFDQCPGSTDRQNIDEVKGFFRTGTEIHQGGSFRIEDRRRHFNPTPQEMLLHSIRWKLGWSAVEYQIKTFFSLTGFDDGFSGIFRKRGHRLANDPGRITQILFTGLDEVPAVDDRVGGLWNVYLASLFSVDKSEGIPAVLTAVAGSLERRATVIPESPKVIFSGGSRFEDGDLQLLFGREEAGEGGS